jgi:phosphomannomutase
LDRRDSIIRFGNDGWHARFDGDFNRDNVARVADALGLAWADAAPGATVYVGYDTRYEGKAFARLLGEVMASYGLRICLSRSFSPTPAVAWACAHDPQAIGAVVITASELSCEYGGIIVRSSDGSSAGRPFLDKVEDLIPAQAPATRGTIFEIEFVDHYLDDLAESVDARVFAARLTVRHGSVCRFHSHSFLTFLSERTDRVYHSRIHCAQLYTSYHIKYTIYHKFRLLY